MNIGLTITMPDRATSFYQIPKNCSTLFRSLKEPSIDPKWTEETVNKCDPNIKMVVILRDPVSRYISAINMFLKREDNLFRQPITWSTYLTEDQHFVTQKRFCEPLQNFTNIDYWYYDNDVVDNMIDHYNLGLWLPKGRRDHESTEKIVTDLNPDWIDEVYKDDYDFINSVTFLNR